MEIGEIKQSDKIGKLKYGKVYILNSMGDNFQGELKKHILAHEKKYDEHNVNYLSLTNRLMLLCYFLCWSRSDSPFYFAFHPIPTLYASLPHFYYKLFIYGLPPCGAQCANEGGGGVGSHGWYRSVCVFAHKIILSRNLMFQIKAQCQVPFRIPVPQGTGELSFMDHSWVKSCDCDCDSTV